MFGGRKPIPLTLTLSDPGGDLTVPVLEVPVDGGSYRIAGARVYLTKAITSDPTNSVAVSLLDGGALGNGTTEIGAVVGGASTAWAVGSPKEFTITDGHKLEPGDRLMVKYDEGGTVAPGDVVIQVDLITGA